MVIDLRKMRSRLAGSRGVGGITIAQVFKQYGEPEWRKKEIEATREMVDFLVAEQGMTASDAYILCSVALDLRITQLVDGTKGVHGMLSKELFAR